VALCGRTATVDVCAISILAAFAEERRDERIP